jgi:hypothetical protein
MKSLLSAFFSFIFLLSTGQNNQKKVLTTSQKQKIVHPDSLFSTATKEENRANFFRAQVNENIQKALSQNLKDTSTERAWSNAFWAMSLLNYKSAWINSRLLLASKELEKRTVPFQRSFFEMAYSSYPTEFINAAFSILNQTSDANLFVLCAEYLLQSSNSMNTRKLIMAAYEARRSKPGFVLTCKLLVEKLQEAEQSIPPIRDLLTQKFYNNPVVVYSLQRKNRDYPGILVIRTPEGKFLRNANGSLFYLPQLARSVYNLPAYISNGNTPQGIYRMRGFDTSKNVFIGPSENLQLLMPFEATPTDYNPKLNKDSVTRWHIAYYKNLLPPSWQQYKGIFDAYYASLIGRTEIIAHGSTINPDYYKSKPYYPLTPSLGCLVTNEVWDKKTGRRIESDQQKLTDAIKKVSGANGYFIVVELNDKAESVSPREVSDLIEAINR